MHDPQPIETKYKGHRFRSRLEARWAVFFDAMGEKWEYEKQGYELKSGRYLPDFWLPRLKLWLEVKGQEPTEIENAKCAELRDHTGNAVLLTHGLPSRSLFTLYCIEMHTDERINASYCMIGAYLAKDYGDDGKLIVVSDKCDPKKEFVTEFDSGIVLPHIFAGFKGTSAIYRILVDEEGFAIAAGTASSARFEFGEEG